MTTTMSRTQQDRLSERCLPEWNIFCDFFTRAWVAERTDRAARFSASRRDEVVRQALRWEASR